MPDFKTCTRCKKLLPVTAFFKWKYAKDGYASQCKDCRRLTEGRKAVKVYADVEHIMDDWTEWHQLPLSAIEKMSNRTHLKYCEWWEKAHPIDIEKLAERLAIAMWHVMDDLTHANSRGIQ